MLAQFSIFPLDKGVKLAKHVAKIIDVIDKSGLPYQTCSMCTLVEGNWDQIMGLIKRCHNIMRRDSQRVYTSITIDDRKGAKGRLQGKVRDLEKILKRKIKR